MVPDVYHILIKSEGIFANVSSEKSKAKLRLVYEVAPISLLNLLVVVPSLNMAAASWT
jgi:sedoheptulose-bisphosphatase